MTLLGPREVLPGDAPITLGEGRTPLLHAAALGRTLGLDRLYIKDEGQNPTSSFKARGLSAAVTVARVRPWNESRVAITS